MQKQKKKKYKAAWWAMMSIVLVFMIFCGIGVISAMNEYTEADAEYQEIREIVRKTEQARSQGVTGQTAVPGAVKENVGTQTEKSAAGTEEEMDLKPHTIRGVQKSNLQIMEENLTKRIEEIEKIGENTHIVIPLGFLKGFTKSVLSAMRSESNRAEQNQAMFEALHEINGDICGWITIHGTAIDYPVMHGETNDSYIRTTYSGGYSVGGSIFMDSANSADFSDMHTIIYGHSMADGTMFKTLYNFTDSGFRDRNPYVYIDLPDRRLIYEVFSQYYTMYWDNVYQEYYEAGPEQLEFLQRLSAASEYPVDYEPKEDDRIITLSTCYGRTGTEYRYVVHAVLVREIR